MTITMCDGCGKRLQAWIRVSTEVGAAYDHTNIGEFVNFQHRVFHLCGDCAERALKRKKVDDA